MSKIQQAFAKAKDQGRAAFIPFVTGGLPDPAGFEDLLIGLAKAGADVIEVGLPFSDPMTDGPAIQESSQKALDAGVTPGGLLDMLAAAAPKVDAPLVIMSYYNPILHMGLDEFSRRAAQAGVCGLIIPDLPPEEAEPLYTAAKAQGIDLIMLATPTTDDQRLKKVLQYCGGFLYYVSMTGVTGAELKVGGPLTQRLEQVRAISHLPVAVGFGVATPQQAASLAACADGVIVGSALVRRTLAEADPAKAVASTLELAQELAQAAVI